MKMLTLVPARKVVAASLGGAVALVFIYILETHFGLPPMDPAVQAAITTIITFIVGYVVPPHPRDQAVASDTQPSSGP